MKQEFKYLRAVYVTLGPYFCIQSCLLEVSVLVKWTHSDCPNSAKKFAFNIFVPIPLQEMVYLI